MLNYTYIITAKVNDMFGLTITYNVAKIVNLNTH